MTIVNRYISANKLVQWIADNAESESRFLYPNPSFIVFAEPLMDFIHEETRIPKNELGAMVDDRLKEMGRL